LFLQFGPFGIDFRLNFQKWVFWHS
jgi:hypothetical protein